MVSPSEHARGADTRPQSSSHVQAVRFVLLLSRQGKVRLAKWYTTYTQKERAKVQWQCASPAGTSAGSRVGASLSLLQVVRDVTPMVLARALKLCNFLDYRDSKVQQLIALQVLCRPHAAAVSQLLVKFSEASHS